MVEQGVRTRQNATRAVTFPSPTPTIATCVKILFLIRLSQLTGRLLRRIGLEVQAVQAVLLTNHYAAVVAAEMRQKALTAVRKLAYCLTGEDGYGSSSFCRGCAL